MVGGLDILVLSLPGLSARMLRAHESRLPHLRELAAATVVVLDSASPAQLEASLVIGLAPEFHAGPDVQPFWLRAGVEAKVALEQPLRSEWRAFSKSPRLEWRTFPSLLTANIPAALAELDAAAQPDRALVVLSAWALADGAPAGQAAHPLDRPVLLTRGFEQAKSCIGILEIAGLLIRALTGERLTDEI